MPQEGSSPRPKPKAGVVIHRACDECRSRKLACTKEPNGCSRCRREGLKCVYSPQKQMGRPRKRRLVDEAEAETNLPASEAVERSQVSSKDTPPSQLLMTTPPQSSGSGSDSGLVDLGLDYNLDFASMYDGSNDGFSNPDLSFLNFYPPFFGGAENVHVPNDLSGPSSLAYAADSQYALNGLQFGGVDLLGGINFNEQNVADQQVSQDINDHLVDIWNFQPILAADSSDSSLPATQQQNKSTSILAGPDMAASNPGPSSTTSTLFPPDHDTDDSVHSVPSPSTSTSASNTNTNTNTNTKTYDIKTSSSPKPLPQASCACLSHIYLSLDSLSKLPEDVSGAMKSARNAAKVAHDVLICPDCSTSFTENPMEPPTMQMLQNMMLLGAMIPTITNAYVQILELIDAATARAKATGGKIMFRFEDYGGVWGQLAENEREKFEASQQYDNSEMDPEQWRLTIRALLKFDVYGFRPADGDKKAGHNGYQSLRDIVNAMENRSNLRHDRIDALMAAGHPRPCTMHGSFTLNGAPQCDAKGDRNCLKIIEMARASLDKLVIS